MRIKIVLEAEIDHDGLERFRAATATYPGERVEESLRQQASTAWSNAGLIIGEASLLSATPVTQGTFKPMRNGF